MISSPIHRYGFCCYFLGEDISATEIWDKFVLITKKLHLAEPLYTINRGLGKRRKFRDGKSLLTPEAIRREIIDDDTNSFVVNGATSRIQSVLYTPTPLDGGLQRFNIALDPLGQTPEWDIFAEVFGRYRQLVLAHPFNQFYTPWQNCSDPSRYRRLYGEIEGFPTYETDHTTFKSIWYDISKNPGRTSRKGLLLEHVASELWLGPMFWELAPCTKEEVLAADFLLEVRDTPDFLYLKSWPRLFTRPDGEQGRVQQKLWRLLFHEDCEWPPGSGGISDVPVGGPPELMPDPPQGS
jgi:hypothetical protein